MIRNVDGWFPIASGFRFYCLVSLYCIHDIGSRRIHKSCVGVDAAESPSYCIAYYTLTFISFYFMSSIHFIASVVAFCKSNISPMQEMTPGRYYKESK